SSLAGLSGLRTRRRERAKTRRGKQSGRAESRNPSRPAPAEAHPNTVRYFRDFALSRLRVLNPEGKAGRGVDLDVDGAVCAVGHAGVGVDGVLRDGAAGAAEQGTGGGAAGGAAEDGGAAGW